MRALALGWLAGTLWLRTRADLPPTMLSLLLLVAGALALAAFALLVNPLKATHRFGRPICVLMLLIAGSSRGAGWSS